MGGYVDKNFNAIANALRVVQAENTTLKIRMAQMEKNLILLQAEMNNQKQLTAHVLGRGMGPTLDLPPEEPKETDANLN